MFGGLSLCRTKYNLNALSHDTAIDLIRKVIMDGVKLSEVGWFYSSMFNSY